jgi:hypothetical protein
MLYILSTHAEPGQGAAKKLCRAANQNAIAQHEHRGRVGVLGTQQHFAVNGSVWIMRASDSENIEHMAWPGLSIA